VRRVCGSNGDHCSGVDIAFDATACDQPDRDFVIFAEVVLGAATDHNNSCAHVHFVLGFTNAKEITNSLERQISYESPTTGAANLKFTLPTSFGFRAQFPRRTNQPYR
jgi:hypothetical protein